MAASILDGPILPVSGSMSTKNGFMPFHYSACVIATKLYGVVITSPVILNACKVVIKGRVPLVKEKRMEL